MAKGDWVHRDEHESMKALYEIRIANLVDELAAKDHELSILQDNGHTADEYIQDAEIVED